jgi:hypothetical protein
MSIGIGHTFKHTAPHVCLSPQHKIPPCCIPYRCVISKVMWDSSPDLKFLCLFVSHWLHFPQRILLPVLIVINLLRYHVSSLNQADLGLVYRGAGFIVDFSCNYNVLSISGKVLVTAYFDGCVAVAVEIGTAFWVCCRLVLGVAEWCSEWLLDVEVQLVLL